MNFYARFCDEDDPSWEKLWLDYAADPQSRDDLPRFPPADVQQRLHGTTFERAMTGALALRHFTLRYVRQVLETHIVPEMKLLDFGCGWGRLVRTFLKDFHTQNIIATDVDVEVIELARELLPDVAFAVNGARAALDHRDASLDIVVVNSVFSHLSPANYAFWIEELTRVLKPGGALVFTTWGQGLLDMAKRVFETGEREFAWQRNIVNGFASWEDMHGRFSAGEFVFSGTGGGKYLPPEDFGIAMVPRRWFETHAKGLVLRDLLDDPQQFSQAVFFAQRT
jgi:SAM-dependent methyltransferase